MREKAKTSKTLSLSSGNKLAQNSTDTYTAQHTKQKHRNTQRYKHTLQRQQDTHKHTHTHTQLSEKVREKGVTQTHSAAPAMACSSTCPIVTTLIKGSANRQTVATDVTAVTFQNDGASALPLIAETLLKQHCVNTPKSEWALCVLGGYNHSVRHGDPFPAPVECVGCQTVREQRQCPLQSCVQSQCQRSPRRRRRCLCPEPAVGAVSDAQRRRWRECGACEQ